MAEARVQVGMGLWCANQRGEVLRRLYAMRGARWSYAQDQMVTGASPAMSTGGGAFGHPRSSDYGVPGRKHREGLDGEAHNECGGARVGSGERLVRSERR